MMRVDFFFKINKGVSSFIREMRIGQLQLTECLQYLGYITLYKGWFWGETVCKFIAIFDYITAGTEFLSVAMVALSKCINLIKPKLGERLFSDVAGKVCIGFIWIIAWIYNIIMYKFKVCRCYIQTYK